MHFELIFKGETSPRVTLEQGQAALARLFKLDIKQSAHQQKLSKLFSGSSIVIKKDLSDEAAQQIKAKLAKLGLICHIRTSKTNSASPAAPTVANPDTESGFQGVQLIQETQPEALKVGESEVITPRENLVTASSYSDEDVEGLSLVAQEEKTTPSTAQDSSKDDEQGGLSLVAMDQKPANQIHDESTTTAQEPVGSLAQANTVSVGQGQLAGGYKTHVRDDTSGGSGSYIPDEVSGWCWGGFFWGWIWSIFNRTWIGLLGLIPIVNIPVAVMLGLKGRQWAWQNCRWEDVDHFNRVQRNWSLTGLVFASLGLWLYWSGLSTMDEMVDEQGVLKEEYIESIQDEKQREALRNFQKQLKEELKKQQASQSY